ncbi:hypothetical protein GSI_06047 [Ganoderma sinense ZZ0214-1]|uniref:GST N-terminal domain-containing protein n=1 Tax=Ganoderma sinense ZZ0214-1 TaxID=1077348 RepID=A0A2G8SC66_9APHY|nr:hypothetical protein GSI_06047 [Ganoderma sinense ZZ0214-1]
MPTEPIVFYDLPSKVKGTSWSGNTLKIKFTLEYKRLPYKTVFVEFPDIARVSREIGASPTGTWPDGSPKYTVPAIYDPSTKTAVADSMVIARYLDATYPDTPRAIPEGTEAFHETTMVAIRTVIGPHSGPLVMTLVPPLLSPDSGAYYSARVESMLGESLMKELSVVGSAAREERWMTLESAMGKLAQWIEVDGKKRKFFMGDMPCFADFIVGAGLVAMKRVLGEDGKEWRRVAQWHGGRWARLVAALEELFVQ